MEQFREELRYAYPALTPSDVVIDAGCYEGRWAHEMHARYGCDVLALEPVPEFFARCAQRFAGNAKIRVRQVALGDHCGTVNVGIQGDSSGFYCGSAARAEVEMITLPWLLGFLEGGNIAGKSGPRDVGVLKLNIEGAEFSILEHLLQCRLADRFRHIQVQPHAVVPNAEARWETILTGLSRTHDIVAAEPWCWYLFSRRAEAS